MYICYFNTWYFGYAEACSGPEEKYPSESYMLIPTWEAFNAVS